ncbi:major facilitator superfamily domain-containing protein [Powellomyces hirtus]|nr:major facilitator superfamily domain-containing protein [Powellomyces hirtus]
MSTDESEPHPYRWWILACGSVVLIGNYYVYDTPGALSASLRLTLHASPEKWQHQLGVLYSAYSAPNILLPFICAAVVAKYRAGPVLVALSVMVAAGAAVIAGAVQTGHFEMMLVGRMLLGFAGESMGVAQARITCSYFSGPSLAIALGLNLAIARFGSILNDIVSPAIAASPHFSNPENGTIAAMWAGFCMCALSLVAAVIVVLLDACALNTHPQPSSRATATKPPMPNLSRMSSFTSFPHPEAPIMRQSPDQLNRRNSVFTSRSQHNLKEWHTSGAGYPAANDLPDEQAREDSILHEYLQGTPTLYGTVQGDSYFEPIRPDIGPRRPTFCSSSSSFTYDQSIATTFRTAPYRSSMYFVDVMPHIPERSPLIDRSGPHDPAPAGVAQYIADSDTFMPRLSVILSLPWPFYMLVIPMVCFYGATICLIIVTSDFAQAHVPGVTLQRAGLFMCLTDLVATLLIPVIGSMVAESNRGRGRWYGVTAVGAVMSAVFFAWAQGFHNAFHIAAGLIAVGLCHAVYSSVSSSYLSERNDSSHA